MKYHTYNLTVHWIR